MELATMIARMGFSFNLQLTTKKKNDRSNKIGIKYFQSDDLFYSFFFVCCLVF